MILHIIPNDKFAPQFIDFIEKHYNYDEHRIVVLSYHGTIFVKNPQPNKVELIYKNASSFYKLFWYMRSSNSIIVHGFFSRAVMALLIASRSIEKSYIVLWGGDFYCYRYESKKRIQLMRYVLRRCRGIVTLLEEDYLLAKKWFGIKAQFFPCMLYYNCVIDNALPLFWKSRKCDDQLVVQIGNSADPSNDHISVLQELSRCSIENIQLIIPLSYAGNPDYVKSVTSMTNSLFPGKARILTELIPIEEYIEIQKGIDVAIFAHNRQQALGNIYSLLAMGKKVYLRPDITTYSSLIKQEITVYSIEDIQSTICIEIPEALAQKNQEIIKKMCSIEQLKRDWDAVFEDAHQKCGY